MSAARLAPTPPCGQPSSTITQRLVLCTEARIVSRSSGRSVRGSITSALTPCCSASVAAARSEGGGRLAGHRPARGPDDGNVGALAREPRLAEADQLVLPVGHLAAHAVERLV